MKTRTPHHHCVRFFCHDNGCILMMLLFVLGYWSTESRGEQPKIRRASLAGITCNGQNTKPNTKEMPTQAQEDEAADPQLPGSGILSPATIISAPSGTSFRSTYQVGKTWWETLQMKHRCASIRTIQATSRSPGGSLTARTEILARLVM